MQAAHNMQTLVEGDHEEPIMAEHVVTGDTTADQHATDNVQHPTAHDSDNEHLMTGGTTAAQHAIDTIQSPTAPY